MDMDVVGFDVVFRGRVWSGGRAARLRARLIVLVVVLALPVVLLGRSARGRPAVESADPRRSCVPQLLRQLALARLEGLLEVLAVRGARRLGRALTRVELARIGRGRSAVVLHALPELL